MPLFLSFSKRICVSTRQTARAAAFLLLILALTRPSAAQAVPTAIGPGTSVRLGGGASTFKIDYGKRTLGGYQAWTDINPYWRYGVEGEMRSLAVHQDDGTHATTYLAGPRIVIRPGPIQPYVKALAGAGLFTFPFGYGHGTYFVAAGGGGVDLRLPGRLQLRAIDFEYQMWPQFTFGAMKPYGISTGISLQLYGGLSRMGHMRR